MKNSSATLAPACKSCSACSRILPASDFNKCSSSSTGLRYSCRECDAKARSIRVRINQEYVWNLLLNDECRDCGIKDIRVLQFDHIRGVKIDEIANIIAKYSLKVLKEELEKCIPRCANCHQIKTGRDYKWAVMKFWDDFCRKSGIDVVAACESSKLEATVRFCHPAV
jgi:hypothetical protein